MSLDHEDTTKTSDSSPLNYMPSKACKLELKQKEFIQAKKKKELEIISLISKIINEIVEENKNGKKNSLVEKSKLSFYMKNLPNIKFEDYLIRINKYLKPEVSSFVLALIYIDRICSNKKNNISLIENNIFKLFLAAITLAIKFNEDYYDANNYFAKVGGITLVEMNMLEKEFLNLIDFRMWVDEDIYIKYNDYLTNY